MNAGFRLYVGFDARFYVDSDVYNRLGGTYDE